LLRITGGLAAAGEVRAAIGMRATADEGRMTRSAGIARDAWTLRQEARASRPRLTTAEWVGRSAAMFEQASAPMVGADALAAVQAVAAHGGRRGRHPGRAAGAGDRRNRAVAAGRRGRDRRRGAAGQRDRRADQPSCAGCDDRGRARREAGKGFTAVATQGEITRLRAVGDRIADQGSSLPAAMDALVRQA
jgi:hypothetical protein